MRICRRERLSIHNGEIGNGDDVGLRASTSIDTPIKEVCSSFENLYKATYICKRNIMWKDSVAGFVKNALKNCITLQNELRNDTYKISKYSIFIIREKKTRIIVSTRMRDRVVQRSLCDNYLYKELTKGFIYDNCACLIGKGTDFARNRLKCHMQRFYRKHGLDGYVLKVDIHDYFGSTRHDVAKRAVAKRVKDEWAKAMVFDVIDSFTHIAPDRGMGLGSQITQLIQLAVLDDLDHEIKERMKIKYYVRYMDDFILIHHNKEYLKECLAIITERLHELSLELNTKKTDIQPIKHGVKFLGFKFILTNTGSVVLKILPKKASKERKKLKKLSKHVDKESLIECYKSWRSHVDKGNSYHVLCGMDNFFRELIENEY